MAEHLHYIEVLQPLHGFLKDVSHLELDVAIDPCDVLPIGDNAAQMFDAKPDCVLLHPEFLIRPQAKVERVIEVGNLKWPVAEGDLHRHQRRAKITHVRSEALVKGGSAAEASRIKYHRDHIELIGRVLGDWIEHCRTLCLRLCRPPKDIKILGK
jgi:hypothetical protein